MTFPRILLLAPKPSDPVQLGDGTRTRETESHYLERGRAFVRSVAARSANDQNAEPHPLDVIAAAIANKVVWTRSTWRQNKASLVFLYTEFPPREWPANLCLDAAVRLKATSNEGCKKKSSYAGRQKRVTDEELQALIKAVLATRSKYKDVCANWLALGSLIGLRPHEWCTATLVEGEVDGDWIPLLRVGNSKFSNGRANGAFRHFDLRECPDNVVRMIGSFAGVMHKIDVAGKFERVHDGCCALLRSLQQGKPKRIHLYSARHKFSSDAKSVMSLQQVAALMGHATDGTACRHYGKRRYGSGGLMVTPLKIEVATVRNVNQKGAAPSMVNNPSANLKKSWAPRT